MSGRFLASLRFRLLALVFMAVLPALGLVLFLAWEQRGQGWDEIYRNLIGLSFVSLLALTAAWVGGEIFIRRRVRALLVATQRVSNGELSVRIEKGEGEGEIGELTRAFNHMATSLETQRQQLIEAERLKKDVELAEAIQLHLLPRPGFSVPGLEVAAAYLPSNKIGGDYYDVFELEPPLVGAVIADVAGHSISSGLLMSAAATATRYLSALHPSRPSEILRELNGALYRELKEAGLFVTIILAVLDPAAKTIRYASAGHNPALLYRQTRDTVQWLPASGPPIGIYEDPQFEESDMLITNDDLLVLYTDGVTEARDPKGQLFGTDGLLSAVRTSAASGPQGTTREIVRMVQSHSEGRLLDDVTLLVLRLSPRRQGAGTGLLGGT